MKVPSAIELQLEPQSQDPAPINNQILLEIAIVRACRAGLCTAVSSVGFAVVGVVVAVVVQCCCCNC